MAMVVIMILMEKMMVVGAGGFSDSHIDCTGNSDAGALHSGYMCYVNKLKLEPGCH